jgi:biotin-(acetyl-CoA carboxylase) ligase
MYYFLSFIPASNQASEKICEIEVKALDIDNDGCLLVRKESGDVCRIISGDVSLSNRV